MSATNMHEAKSQLSKLVQKALDGEEIIIARGNKPLVRLVPVEPPAKHPRRIGWAKGAVIYYMSDDFDAPLEEFKNYL